MRAIFETVPIFAGLNEAALQLLTNEAEEMSAPAGSVIVSEGEPGHQMYVIASGLVRVCKRFDRADEVELARLRAGNFFGEMCILETLPRAATVQAVPATMLYTLSSQTFYHLFKTIPEQYCLLVLNIARDLSRRLRHLDELYAAQQ
jgi:CRP/FNR family transcriptional regulator, cyclic AMP receptor protein